MTAKQVIQLQILEGALTMPNITKLRQEASAKEYKTVTRMFEAAFKAYLKKGFHITNTGLVSCSISMPYWAKQIKNPIIHNKALKILSRAGWFTVVTRPNSNWSEAYINESKLLEYIDEEQLAKVRMFHKFFDYKLTYHDVNQDMGATRTKIKGEIKDTGLVREGFALAGTVPFRFDTRTMDIYSYVVKDAVNKGITKMMQQYPQIAIDHANYKEIGSEIIDFYITNNATYNAGPRTNDPRGRDNSGYLNRIGNPVGFKVMRSLLVIPEEHRNPVTKNGLYNKFMFIAELLGFKNGSKWDKISAGKQAYLASEFHEVEYSEATADEVFENIWLERLYADIDNYFGTNPFRRNIYKARGDFKSLLTTADPSYRWQVPIEIDMSASVLGFIGLLLNHKPFLDRCNITNGPLTDAWAHDVITNRKQFKTIMRQCYGSQMSAEAMWDAMNIEHTQEEVNAFNNEMKQGDIAVAIAFKDFIINNCNMQEEMKFDTLGEQFTTFCNRWNNVGEHTNVFDLYNSATDSILRVHNTDTIKVANLRAFRRYSVTGLIHNLDSRVMDNTMLHTINKYGWALPIHDAAICCCEAAGYVREVYANGTTKDEPSLKWVHTNRNTILTGYFKSIGISAKAVKTGWSKVRELVTPLEEELIVNPMVLK